MSDKSLNKDVNSIVRRPRITQRPRLPQASKIAQPATNGVASVELAKGQASTGGISSPLTEVSRTESTIQRFDQFDIWSYQEIQVTQLIMSDSLGAEVVFDFREPT